MLNVKWALRSAWFLNTNLTNRTNSWLLTEVFNFPHGSHGSHGFLLLRSFCFPTRISRISRILTPHGVFAVRLSESTIACNEEDPWDPWDPCATSLSFWLLTEFLLVNHGEYRCLQWRRSVGSVRSVCDFSFWITMQRYNISFSQLTDAHRCSPIFTDFHW